MKFGFSLETVNMLTSSPNFIYKQSKSFWADYFKFIAAVNFRGIELPFNPFNSDPMAFEIGRCGIPCSAFSIKAKYGSPNEFLAFLKNVGIDEVVSVHMNANDAQLEANAVGYSKNYYFDLLEEMGSQAVEHIASLKGKGLVVSPTPEIGWLKESGVYEDEDFKARTISFLNRLCDKAAKHSITVALKAEYWSLFRGKELGSLLHEVSAAAMSPDLAHMQITGDPIPVVLNAHKNQLAFVHLSDTAFHDEHDNYLRLNAEIPVQGSQRVFCDLGDGEVNLLESVQTLKNVGYDGWVICEQRKTPDVYRGLLKLRWFVDHELTAKLV